MLTIIEFKKRKSSLDGSKFYALIVQGNIDISKSANGNFYATSRKASLPCSFNEKVCSSLIGKEIPGKIVQVECDPYEFTDPNTGVTKILTTRNEYRPDESTSTEKTAIKPNLLDNDVQSIIENGVPA